MLRKILFSVLILSVSTIGFISCSGGGGAADLLSEVVEVSDTTGTWSGSYSFSTVNNSYSGTWTMVLTQSGATVTGTNSWSNGYTATISGTVVGDTVFITDSSAGCNSNQSNQTVYTVSGTTMSSTNSIGFVCESSNDIPYTDFSSTLTKVDETSELDVTGGWSGTYAYETANSSDASTVAMTLAQTDSLVSGPIGLWDTFSLSGMLINSTLTMTGTLTSTSCSSEDKTVSYEFAVTQTSMQLSSYTSYVCVDGTWEALTALTWPLTKQ